MDIKGKILLILSEAPGKDDPQSPFQVKELKDKYFSPQIRVYGATTGGMPFSKIRELTKLGPAAILVVSNSGRDSDTYRNLAVPAVRPVNDETIMAKIIRLGYLTTFAFADK